MEKQWLVLEPITFPTGQDPSQGSTWPEPCLTCRQALSSLVKLSAPPRSYHRSAEHHSGPDSLEQSAKNCPLCSLFLEALATPGGTFPGTFIQRLKQYGGQKRPFMLEALPHADYTLIGIAIIAYTCDFGPGLRRQDSFNVERLSGNLSVFAGRDFKTTPPLSQAKEWLDDCLQSHSKCGAVQDKILPTRVIEIGETDDQVRLFADTAGSTGQWLALSHCWGTCVPGLLCSRLNIALLSRNIPIAELPSNLKDAITVTRSLGYLYLWVDTMCIVQDDPEDWDRESGKMEYVYANAVMTLAATSAPDMHSGFLLARQPMRYGPHAHFALGVEACDGSTETAILRVSVAIDDWTRDMDDQKTIFHGSGNVRNLGILDSRAWTFQELQLSRRVLFFLENELYYQCPTGTRQESLHHPRVSESANDPKIRWLSEDENTDEATPPIITDFMTAVERYKELSLTRPTDILPAFSAVAARFARSTGAQYAAGLWREWLDVGLAWQKHHMRLEGLPKNASFDPSAPSWSWASCEGSIRYLPKASAVRNYVSLVDVVSVHAKPKGINEFGEVHGGELGLSGWLRTLSVGIGHIDRHPSFRSMSDRLYGTNSAQVWRDGKEVASLRFERPLSRHCSDPAKYLEAQMMVPTDYVCLLIGSYCYISPNGTIEWTALALEAVPGREAVYRRVGLMCSKDVLDYVPYGASTSSSVSQETLEWFRSGAQETITLV